MLLQRNIIEGPYLHDIMEQPAALRRSLSGFEESARIREFAQALAAGAYKRIVLTGMGSSLYALYPLHLNLINRGYPSLHIETSELIHYLDGVLEEGTLVVAVSQSGQSAEIVRLLQMAQGRAPVIGVTNSENSDLARRSEARVTIQAGTESSVSCKTYVATLLALEWLGANLTGSKLDETRKVLSLAVPSVKDYLVNWREHVDECCDLLEGVEQLFITGRGPSLAAALTGGLILKESARFPAEGMSCAAFRHGPFETLSAKVLVMVLAGDYRSRSLNRGLAKDIAGSRGRSAIVDSDAGLGALRIPALPDSIRSVVEILPVQMISLALAAFKGREAGRFELATKITDVE